MRNYPKSFTLSATLLFLCIGCSGGHEGGLVLTSDKAYLAVPLADLDLQGGQESLPLEVDLSADFPRPGDQGKQASCVGWAVAYALKSYQEGIETGKKPLLADRIFSPSYLYNQLNKSTDCQRGIFLPAALEFLMREGAIPLSAFPYAERSCSRRPTEALSRSARSYSIQYFRRVDFADLSSIKRHLGQGLPILIGVLTDRAFQKFSGGGIYRKKPGRQEPNSGHALVVVGYSENRQAFRIINSWGQDWGDRGFAWIGYESFKKMTREAYVLFDSENPAPKTVKKPVRTVPPPPPPVKGPYVSVDESHSHHNVQVLVGNFIFPGMEFVISGKVEHAAGSLLEVLVTFNFEDGHYLMAAPPELFFRSADGKVRATSYRHRVPNDSFSLDHYTVTIPYYAFGLAPSNYRHHYNLTFTALVYLDGRLVARSTPTGFHLSW